MVGRALSNPLYAYTDDPVLSEAYVNNGLNQVTTADAATVHYDAAANITGVGATGQFAYDHSDRLVGTASGGGLGYDPAGRLYERSAGPYRYLWSGGQALGQYDGAGALVQRYVPGAGLDDYAAYTTGTGGSITRQWPIPDPLGSVTAVINGSNVAVQVNRYDEYGAPASGNAGPFGYAGALFTPEAGSAPWFMRNRQYHPELGRFLQTDPIGYAGGVNLYAYVGGDPVNRIDPWGLQEAPPQPPGSCGGEGQPPCNVGEIVIIPSRCRRGWSCLDSYSFTGINITFVFGGGFDLEIGGYEPRDLDPSTPRRQCPYVRFSARVGLELGVGAVGSTAAEGRLERGSQMVGRLSFGPFSIQREAPTTSSFFGFEGSNTTAGATADVTPRTRNRMSRGLRLGGSWGGETVRPTPCPQE